MRTIDPDTKEFLMNKELQQQNIDAEMAGASPYLLQSQQAIQAALIEQLDPERVVENIELTFKGEVRDMKTNEIVKKGEPIMNELGISRVILSVRSVVNPNTTISAFPDEKMINRLIVSLSDEIGNDLELNWKLYGIKNKADLDRIDGIVKRMAYPALLRSYQGGERRFLGTTTVETINTAPRMTPQKKENFWGRFKL